MKFHSWSVISWSMLVMIPPGYAAAPDKSGQQPVETKEEVLTVETTVNARFVPESNRKIPFTVNHQDNLALEQGQIKDGQSLLWQTPGLALNTDGQNPESSIKIRGVGSVNQVSNDDTSVVTMLNGVPVPVGNITSRLLDIEQVDILKGPQGTLFGRNSEAGAINVTSNKPTSLFTGHIGGEWGTRGHALGEMVVNAPLTDTLNSRVALQYDRKDAALKNEQDGNRPLSHPQNLTGRASLGWQPGEQDSLLLTVDHQRQRHNAVGMTLLDGSDKISLPKGSMDDWGNDTTLTFNWQHRWDELQLTNVTGWGNYYHSSSGPTIDARTSQRLYGTHYNSWRMFSNRQKQFFQELRLGSTAGSPLFWVSGINYIHSGRTLRHNGGWNEMPGWESDPMNAQFQRRFTNNSFALFGETTLPLTNRLDLTTGLRHTWEKLAYRARWNANPNYAGQGPTQQNDNQTLSERYFTGRIGLNYMLSDDWNLYGSWSRGHKSGGFSNWDTSIASGEPSTPYKPSTINSYEMGAKALISSLNLELNPALFYSRTHDDHYYTLLDPSRSFATVTENFDTESKGAEFSATWRPDADLIVKMGVDYTLATLTQLPENSKSGGKKGNRIPDVPRWGASFATDYSRPMQLANLPVVFNANLSYRYGSPREADIGNNFELGETHLLNTRLGFKSIYGDVYLWSTNLLNNRSPVYGFYYPALDPAYGGTGKDAHVGTVREGRAVGISYQYYF
ncbi:TonB-dependent receptor [Buttiauxella warmboldiae]|uniref:TonB-dependent receptor n=1 Tax=Buttiauxella warmboldiae TaxID=82993 RepID=A0A3N5DEB8_9ENTR|nr:TonB-dependent receptor [Buttiauxella warmboldiae]RPH24120.1 TonB-dependent receptor [Buttiauxella warmboldiae]